MGPRNLELPSAAIFMSSGPNERQKKWIYQSIHSRFLFSVSFFLKFSGCAAAPQPRLKSPPLKKKRKGTSRDGYNGIWKPDLLALSPVLAFRALSWAIPAVLGRGVDRGPCSTVIFRTSNRFHSGFKFKYLTICDNYPFIDVTIPTFHLCLFWGEAGPDRDMGLNYSVQSPI
ncbi:hypothetical protein TWF751_010987 [Orbilia oligospora]|nr:hypothetical protein TWF751_010987 [Orbilia oligospora]